MNNKGQVLVIFVIILPIILIALSFVVDYGMLSLQTRNINNNLESVMEEDYTNDEIKTLLEKNIDDSEVIITETDNSIKVEVKKKYKGILFFRDQDISTWYTKLKE